MVLSTPKALAGSVSMDLFQIVSDKNAEQMNHALNF